MFSTKFGGTEKDGCRTEKPPRRGHYTTSSSRKIILVKLYKKKKRKIATSLAVNEVELPRLGAYEEIFEQLGRFS